MIKVKKHALRVNHVGIESLYNYFEQNKHQMCADLLTW
jgi:hypothetical protein